MTAEKRLSWAECGEISRVVTSDSGEDVLSQAHIQLGVVLFKPIFLFWIRMHIRK